MARLKGSANKAGAHADLQVGAAPPLQFPQEEIRAQRVREGALFAHPEVAKVATDFWRSENTLGRNIATARESAGYTQEDFASALGISERTLRRYESGEKQPDVATLRIVSMITGVPSDWLLGLMSDEARDLLDYYEFSTPSQREGIVRLAKTVQAGEAATPAQMAEKDKDAFLARTEERIERAKSRSLE